MKKMPAARGDAAYPHWLTAIIPAGDLLDPGWRLVADNARLIRAEQGAELFHAGDPCKDFVIVLAGCIRVQYLDTNGHEIVLYRVQRGETCILTTSCLLGYTAYPAEGIAEEALHVALLPMAVFRQTLAHETIRNFVFSSMAKRIVDLMMLIDDIAFCRMDRRLAQFLLKQGRRVYATHQDIAVELGSAREVISRLLKDFERRGWVSLRRGQIEVNAPERLAELGCD